MTRNWITKSTWRARASVSKNIHINNWCCCKKRDRRWCFLGLWQNRTPRSINLKCLSNVWWALSLTLLVQISKIKWTFAQMKICPIYQSQLHLQMSYGELVVSCALSWGLGGRLGGRFLCYQRRSLWGTQLPFWRFGDIAAILDTEWKDTETFQTREDTAII